MTLGAAVIACVAGCSRDSARSDDARLADSAYAEVQSRGTQVMGVDQYTSSHVFEDLPNGGRIVLERDDPADTAGIATIRAHMREIAAAFREGDFQKPFAVHATEVPSTRVMAERRDNIEYEVMDRAKGAELRLKTADAAAVAAIHSFLAFQRADHRAPGKEGANHPTSHADHTAHPGGG